MDIHITYRMWRILWLWLCLLLCHCRHISGFVHVLLGMSTAGHRTLRATEFDAATILSDAAAKGTSGAQAASIQVLSLMWLRTTVNYQYSNGGSTVEALQALWAEGGVRRLYSGLPLALVQGPLSRFGDTAANALVLGALSSSDFTASLPLFFSTGLASVAAGAFRIALMPMDTVKTNLQVNGDNGWDIIRHRMQHEGPGVLYAGGLAASMATFVGHWPWFATYNELQAAIPPAVVLHEMPSLCHWDASVIDIGRSAFIGLGASCVSDICSNSIRVLKTTRQAAVDPTNSKGVEGYAATARGIVEEGGLQELFGRGLSTRLVSNAIQGTLFSVLFKYFQQRNV